MKGGPVDAMGHRRKAAAAEGRGQGRDAGGRSLSVLPGGRVPELSVPPPRVSPPARARWGARGAAPAARPHCDVAGPRQRLRRPPALLRPPLSPSVRPSLPPSSRALVSPGPNRGRRREERDAGSLCNFAPGDTLRVLGTPGAPFVPRVPSARGRAVPLQRATRGDRCGNPGSFTPGDPSRSRLALVQGLFFSLALALALRLLLPRMVPEAGMGCAEAPRSCQGGAKAW
ncbi:proline-rich protein 34 [Mus pahari]|uniref:proline-rich protein 34 n=1 Tax=Mus pahari TaxID=10093 RepID=UPI000A30F214|nr:proline-rich protein 34 [Mus pahari]